MSEEFASEEFMIHNMKCFFELNIICTERRVYSTSSFIVLTICHVSVVMKCVLIDVYASSSTVLEGKISVLAIKNSLLLFGIV